MAYKLNLTPRRRVKISHFHNPGDKKHIHKNIGQIWNKSTYEGTVDTEREIIQRVHHEEVKDNRELLSINPCICKIKSISNLKGKQVEFSFEVEIN